MNGCDRDAVWNIVIPLKLDDCPRMAASLFSHTGGRPMKAGQATMWDACWDHQGLGNTTSESRIFLHLLFLPFWMFVPDVDAQDWKFDNDRLVDQIEVIARGGSPPLSAWRHVTQIQKSMEEEYNKDRSGKVHRLYDGSSPLLSWMRRGRNSIPTDFMVQERAEKRRRRK